MPDYPETIAYVRKVTDLHQRLKPVRAVDQARARVMPAAAPPPAPIPGRG
ncbi:hypothetical protein [Hydrogenophaga sp.]|nr:hypothetical protein [Hydrogenophaga sp.]